MRKTAFLIPVILFFSLNAFTQLTTNRNPDTAKIVTSDIELFWKAFDKATPENMEAVFREEYLQKGSIGLQEFTRLRINNSRNLAAILTSRPKYYRALREPSLKVINLEKQIRTGFKKLRKIYADAVFPDIYFMIGRMNSAGTISDKGLLIGVDMFGKDEKTALEELSDWHKAVLSSTDRLPYIVAHELIHYQQKYGTDNTLLARALREGSADFVAQLIAGDTINPHLHKYGNPIEKELWESFKTEISGTNVDNWLYQGEKAKDKPADLGYYMGYKISESYYKNAKDKKQAVKDILEIKDFARFLADSRYEEKFR